MLVLAGPDYKTATHNDDIAARWDYVNSGRDYRIGKDGLRLNRGLFSQEVNEVAGLVRVEVLGNDHSGVAEHRRIKTLKKG